MKIGDRVFVRGYIDEIRKDTVIIRNAGGYFGTIPSEVITGELPSAQPDRMKLVQQTVNTIMSTSRSYSIRDKAFRNAARFVQCAIDGEAPDFEQIPEGDEMPSAQPQSCKDAVSKADVLETYAELYDVFDDNKEIKNEPHKIYDKINTLQAAQPQQTCEYWDSESKFCALYRPSAQPQLEICPIYGGMCGYPSNLCYECPRHEGAKERPQWWTEGLQPFAQPQRIKGKWVRISPAKIYECSICGKNVMTSDIDAYDYCHGCGNPMEVIRDENQTGPNDEVN